MEKELLFILEDYQSRQETLIERCKEYFKVVTFGNTEDIKEAFKKYKEESPTLIIDNDILNNQYALPNQGFQIVF